MAKKNLPPGFRYKPDRDGVEYRFTTDDGKRHSIFAKNVKECYDKAERLRDELAKKAEEAAKKAEETEEAEEAERKEGEKTLSEFFEEWIRRKKKVTEATIIHNRDTFRRIDKEMGDLRIKDIKIDHIEAFHEKLEKEINDDSSRLKTHGANNALKLLRAIFKSAHNRGAITSNPVEMSEVEGFKRSAKEVPVKKTVHRRLKQDELERFFQVAEISFYKHLFAFLSLTGVRIGEALALYWTDIDSETDEINIERSVTKAAGGKIVVGDHAKTDAGERAIQMTDEIRGVLEEQRKMMEMYFDGNVPDLVFPSTTGEVARPSSIDTIMKGFCDKAGVKRFTCHAFRHTFASNKKDAGVAAETLKTILGHADVKITLNTYYHSDKEKEREAMEKKVVPFEKRKAV